MGDEVRSLEGGGGGGGGCGGGERCKGVEKETEALPPRRTVDNLPSLSLRLKMRCAPLLANLQEVLLGTRLFFLLPAVPLAVAAYCYNLGHAWVFVLSMAGLAPLAERVSFLSEQIAYYSGPTVGGLLNATCGNAPELIIALLALHKEKIGVLKWSLLGSILSSLLLVLGFSLFCGSLANLRKENTFDRRQADVNISLLLLSATCHILALMYHYTESTSSYAVGAVGVLKLSRYCSIVMLLAYLSCLFFQLKTHRQHFEAQEEEGNDNDDRSLDPPQIGFASSFAWLIGMTIVVAVLSDYVVGTIEAVSDSWDMSVSFISIILLPLVGNAADHASAIIFAFKNKIDIALSVTLGSASQISMFVIPLCVIVAWTKGINLDLDFKLLETGSLAMAILITAFSLQDGTWHYYKGSILLFCYFIISAQFFILRTSTASNLTTEQTNVINLDDKMRPTRFLKV